MSEQGWREFLSAEGVDDWVVLHGGPTAVFRVGSHRDAARLAQAVADLPGLLPRTILTMTEDRLTVKLTREMWGVEGEHVELARAISAVARDHAAVPDRSAVQEVQLAVAARPEEVDVGFWRAVLGYDSMAPDNGIDPLGQGSTFWMQDLNPAKPLRHAMHVDLSVAREHAEARLAAALAAGGRIVDDSGAPAWWTLSDRAGNKVDIAAWPDGAPEPQPEERAADGEPRENVGDIIREAEHSRLQALVDRDMATADALHADDYQLVTPGGRTYTKSEYLEGVAAGRLRYRRFEPQGEIAVQLWGSAAAARYQVLIEIDADGTPYEDRCWHTDLYERRGGRWQVVWSQATRINE